MLETFTLLIAFQIKHFLADYPLQRPYMYTWKGMPTHWIGPLSDHALVHAVGTAIIIVGYRFSTDIPVSVALSSGLIVLDYTTHFIIDRWKATQPGGPDTSAFWRNLGIDQMLHHLVGIFIIYLLLTQGQ